MRNPISRLVAVAAIVGMLPGCSSTEETITSLSLKEGRIASLTLDPSWRPDTGLLGELVTVRPRVLALDPNDRPLAGARVLIRNDSVGWREAITGANGIAQFGPITRRALAVGEYAIARAIADPANRFNPYSEEEVDITVPVRGLRLQMSVESGNDQSIPVFGQTGDITIAVRDELNRPAANVALEPPGSQTGNIATSVYRTDANGRMTLRWRPGERFGANRFLLTVSPSPSWDLSNNPTAEIRATQTLPTTAVYAIARTDSIGSQPVTTGPSGICRRMRVAVSVAAFNSTYGFNSPVDRVPLTIRVQRPATSLRCPGTSADTLTLMRDTLDFQEIPIFGGPFMVPVVLGAAAGTNTITVTVGNLPDRSLAITTVRQPVITVSGPMQLPYRQRSTVPATITVRDTLGTPIQNLSFRVFVETSLNPGYSYFGPNPLSTGTTGSFSLVDLQANLFPNTLTTENLGSVLLLYNRTGVLAGQSVPTELLVPYSVLIPVGSTMTIAGTPPTTVARFQNWRVTVNLAGPGNQILYNLSVTRHLVSGPPGVTVPPLQLFAETSTNLPFDFVPTVAGTYTFEWRRAGFPSLSRTVTVQ